MGMDLRFLVETPESDWPTSPTFECIFEMRSLDLYHAIGGAVGYSPNGSMVRIVQDEFDLIIAGLDDPEDIENAKHLQSRCVAIGEMSDPAIWFQWDN